MNILVIERSRRFGRDLIRPAGQRELQPGDVLLADVQAAGVEHASIFARHRLEVLSLGDESRYFTSRTQEIGMVEALVPVESGLAGKTLQELRPDSDYSVTAIGLRHGRRPVGPGRLTETIRVGDTLLLFGFWSDLGAPRRGDADLVPLKLPAEFDEVLSATASRLGRPSR